METSEAGDRARSGGQSLGAGSLVAEENYFLGYTFTDRSHSSRVVQSIMDLCLQDGLFADVTVMVEGRDFNLHRLVLSAQSSFFRSMFTSNLREAHTRSIQLKDVSASVFQLLVDYIYHGTVKLTVEELQETYEMADMYQLTALFEECSRFLSRTVDVKNCLQEIGEKVHIYLIGKEETRTHSLAVSLHCDEDDTISVSGQNSLCHQITAACKHGPDLYVVGGSIPRRMWKCNMQTMDWERCAPLPRDRLSHTMVSVSLQDAVYSLGGKTLQDTLSNAVIYYTVKDNVWTETSPLDTAVSGAAGVNLGGTIYVLGGEENDMDFFTKPSRLIQCFDTQTQKCQLKHYVLPFAGVMHAAAHMDLLFIVAEGDSLICYNPLLESFTRLRFPEVWSCVPSFWKVASCNGSIYVFRERCTKGDAHTLKFNPATTHYCQHGVK
ncbi:unnamed protein product [Coregonus sp. 'balchen']|nr:unnamed protein product [Coregonus sp. 'balchen']